MRLMAPVRERAPYGMTNAEDLLRDQFVEHVQDGALRRELMQYVRRQPMATLLDVWSEAIRWEREGLPGGSRGRSQSVSSAFGLQYGVQGSRRSPSPLPGSELVDIREMLRLQQELKLELNQLTQCLSSVHSSQLHQPPSRRGPVLCRRCQQPGHYVSECDGVHVPSRTQSSFVHHLCFAQCA